MWFWGLGSCGGVLVLLWLGLVKTRWWMMGWWGDDGGKRLVMGGGADSAERVIQRRTT